MRIPPSTTCAVNRCEKPGESRRHSHWSLRNATMYRRDMPLVEVQHGALFRAIVGAEDRDADRNTRFVDSERMTRKVPPALQAKLVRPIYYPRTGAMCGGQVGCTDG